MNTIKMELHDLRCFEPLWPSIFHVTAIVLFSISIFLCMQPATCLRNNGNETDRLALLEFKDKIRDDPHNILRSWNDSAHFCSWQGVSCSIQHQRVTSLDLHGLSFSGTISPYVGNLSFLRFTDLGDNSFHGEIPQEVGRLFRLRHLNLSQNAFGGEIPVNISYCTELRNLDVQGNRLVGKIPAELGSLKKLVILAFARNNLTGEIPRSTGNFSFLEFFSVAFNNMEGNIPSEMGQLKSLSHFSIAANSFTGTIPSGLYNISSMTLISFTHNELNGTLPANIGLTLPNLQIFAIGENQFHGSIPASFVNLSYLEVLDLPTNNFRGKVPTDLGNLSRLKRLSLGYNFLGYNSSQDLSFIQSLSNCSNLGALAFALNNFGGTLPNSIANLTTNLIGLYLGGNRIVGRIPTDIANLVNLYVIDMEGNLFSGAIPNSLGSLQKLQALSLANNLLSGEIPPSLGNLTQLSELYLEGNKLEGHIITSLGNCKNLKVLKISNNNLIGPIPPQVIGLSSLSIVLNLSQNSLTGPLPLEIDNLKNLNALDVSENKLSGEIPETVGECLSLEFLYMQGNSLQGSIPSSLASLRGLQYLDLSRNNLSGKIQEELEKLIFLHHLNLSFNDLEGEVPTKGVFSNVSAISLVGNSKLCGGIPELKLPKCLVKPKRHKSYAIMILVIVSSSIVIFTVVTTSLCFFYPRKSRNNRFIMPFMVDKHLQISYNELFQATGGFSSDNMIGQGSFGSVYKGLLAGQEEKLVAVKVLNLQQHGASKTFIAECKALRNIRHRNLLKILTYCSSIDSKGNEFKAIVFDLMANGSLEMWLHPKESEDGPPRNLNLLQRLRIAIDVASAMHYLYDYCETPIIHCDLKPSNILLNDGMVAHVSDFGLARLLSNVNNSNSEFQMSSIGIKGSIGYMAPEYGTGGEATTNGDVYSYGIILLEMFTGKRPTDEEFKDGLNLHNFVKAALPLQLMRILDPRLLAAEEMEAASMEAVNMKIVIEEENFINEDVRQTRDNVQKCILSVLKIGLACSTEIPRERMNMRDVTRELNIIMDDFLGAGTSKDRPSMA